MAQSKKELSEQLTALGIEFNAKSTIKELTELLAANQKTDEKVEDLAVATAVNDELVKTGEKTKAKAGKRSEKGVKATEEKQAKVDAQHHREEKTEDDVKAEKPRKAVPPTRSRLERRGKHFRKSAEQIEAGKAYSLEEAVALAQKTSHVKFDATVELHLNLGVDPRQADQNIRDSIVLPAGTGKTVNVAVADDALLAKLDKGTIDFGVLIATPDFMPKLGKYARVLGPRGLMPNPKSGTVTTDVDKAVAEAKAGRVEYRVDSTGIVHLGVGKVSFTPKQINDNITAVMTSIKANKPNSVKGTYLQTAHLTTSMGPSIMVDLASIA